MVEEDGKVTGFDWSSAPKKAPKKLTVIPLTEGDGPVAEAESMVTFNYFGSVWGAKKPFDESYSREPVPVRCRRQRPDPGAGTSPSRASSAAAAS